MSGFSLSHLSDIVTQLTNKTGVADPILKIEPKDGTRLRFLNWVPTGESKGMPIFMDLRDANDNPLPVDTASLLMLKRPGDSSRIAMSVEEDNLAAWNALTIAEQRNEENIDAVKVELEADAVNIRDIDEAYLVITSSTQIDWSNSEMYVPRQAVQKLPTQG